MKNIFKKLWLILIFLPQLAFASDTTFGFDMGNLFSVSPSDYSVIFLKRIFGDIGFNLSLMAGSQQRTIFGELFRVFNLGILTIASFIMVFTIIKVIMETSHSGEILGKQKNNGWLVFRTSIGLAALVPSISGYSFLQALVMWFILQGVGFANSAWNTSLDYLKNHGLLYITSSQMLNVDTQLAVDQNLVSSQINSQDSAHGAADSAMLSMACMYNLEYAIKDTLNTRKANMNANPENIRPGQAEAMDRLQNYFSAGGVKPKYCLENSKNCDAAKTLIIPDAIPEEYVNDWILVFNQDTSTPIPTIKIDKIKKVCGTYSWAVQIPDYDVSGYEEAKKIGLQWQIDNFSQTAKRLITLSYSNDKEKTLDHSEDLGCTSQECQALLVGASQYQTAVYSERLTVGSEGSDTKDDQWFLNVEAKGWSLAGRYYYDLAKMNRPTKAKLDPNNYRVESSGASLTGYYDSGTNSAAWLAINDVLNGASEPKYTDALQKIFNYTYLVSNNAVKKAIEMNNEARREAGNKEIPDLNSSLFFKGKTGESFKPRSLGHGDMLTPYLTKRVKNVVDTWLITMRDQTNESGNAVYPDPVVNLMIVGNEMITQASGAWDDVMGKFVDLTALFGALSSIPIITGGVGVGLGFTPFITAGSALSMTGDITANILQLISQLVTAIAFLGLPLVIGVTTPMYITGMVLSVYIPLIPFMIFTLGVISWLILVIESMIAAPIVALGLTHPEGHDLLGKSEQAVMLLLNVFIRPICMVIGLIAAMVLSYIALSVLNASFGGIVDSIFTSAPGYSSNSIKSILLLVIYTFIVMALVNQCFSLIYIVGDKIGTWIGMPAQQSDIDKHLGEVKQGTQQGLQEGVTGKGQSVSAGKEMGSAYAGAGKAVPSGSFSQARTTRKAYEKAHPKTKHEGVLAEEQNEK